jgi:hypothetical protein
MSLGRPRSGRPAAPWTRARRAARRPGWEWVSVQGPVDIIGSDHPGEGVPAEAIPQLLRDIFTAAASTHDNWAGYDPVMAEERRTAVFITPARVATN